MQKREISNLDRLEIGERGKARKTAKAGRKGYSKKSEKASSQRRQNSGKASGAKKRQEGTRQTAYKKERLFNRRQVSEIISHRINSLNNRIEELELELAILRAESSLKKEVDENGTDKQDGN